MENKDLYFDHLFCEMLKDWPEELELKLYTQAFKEIVPTDQEYELVRYENLPWDGKKEKYIVDELYEIENDVILAKYLGRNDEVIWSYLIRAMGIVIHNAAYHISHLRIKDLRKEPVKKEFEEGLLIVLNEDKEDTSWPSEQIELAKRYFAVNYPGQTFDWVKMYQDLT